MKISPAIFGVLFVTCCLFLTISAAGEGCCLEPLDRGNPECDAVLQRYYYDRQTSTCKQFTFSGCGGNKNNFFTLEKCEELCVKRSTSPRSQTPIAG